LYWLTIVFPDGLACQPWTSSNKSGKELPFILVTGVLGEERAVESIKKGAADYILKDRLSRLPVAVRKAFEDKVLRREKVQAEAPLRDSERRFRALVENSADGYALVGPEGTYIYSSPASDGVLGYTPKELSGRNVFELIHPADVKSARELFTLVLKDGSRIWAGHQPQTGAGSPGPGFERRRSRQGLDARRLIGEDIDLSTVLAPGLGLIKADPAKSNRSS
jgi:PAS domain-containing protein